MIVRWMTSAGAVALLLGAGASASPPPEAPHALGQAATLPTDAPPANALPHAALPGFAAQLAERPLFDGPAAWPALPRDHAWAAITVATPETRQVARWNLALAEIARGRGAEAVGPLTVMVADDPDLALVPAWRRASGAAFTLTLNHRAALAALDDPALATDAEACLWRMRAYAGAGQSAEAVREIRCATPALNLRAGRDRTPFLLAGAGAAIATGQSKAAMTWLKLLPDGDPAANLLRGKAMALQGDVQGARLRFDRVALSGGHEERADAALSAIEAGVRTGTLPRRQASARLDDLLFTWRGGPIEQRALRLSLRLATEAHDSRRQLAAGATLFRYGPPGPETAALLAMLRTTLVDTLASGPASGLAEAAGLFWDYRDLAPSGVEGNRIVTTLVDRLQRAGLYARAADLLEYRLNQNAQDLEQGPLATRIASLRILAGRPDAAIRTLRSTDSIPYPPAMRAERLQVEAAALHLMGKRAEAIAALDDIPGGSALAAELYWRANDWQRLAAVSEPALPSTRALGEVGQAIVLRHAIALAMLGDEARLARLRARYGPAFAALPTAATFTILTGQPGTVDPAALGRAMAALPSSSPAGSFGDLLDGGKAALDQTKRRASSG